MEDGGDGGDFAPNEEGSQEVEMMEDSQEVPHTPRKDADLSQVASPAPSSSGKKKQVSLCKMFGISPNKEAETVATQREEIKEKRRCIQEAAVEVEQEAGKVVISKGGNLDKFGNERLNKGGRPKNNPDAKPLRGARGGDEVANRRLPGQAPMRHEVSADETYKMAVKMREAMESGDYGKSEPELARY